MSRLLRGAPFLFLIANAAITLNAADIRADESGDSEARSRFCSQPFTKDLLFRSDASKDLYNAGLWMTGAAGIQFGAQKTTHWSKTNSFDERFRSGFRSDSQSTRDDAGTASDVLLAVTAGLLPLASIGKTLSERDCY
jgi:hypothetical protein